ncbi:MAG TPA: M24 family metallopeptidase [Kineosporiaceae bacterium]|nr:M24 family metallopeptidase [Kineosporiaceae bacterium]
MTKVIEDESVRAARLLDAQAKAGQLFDAIVDRGLIVAGAREVAVSDAIRDLAAEMFGTTRFWHKRIVRSGVNTLLPYRDNPPDRMIDDDDIVFADFGPIFEEFEADFGRTFVLGDDPVKHRLREALPTIFAAGRAFFDADPEITGERLFRQVEALAEQDGWEFGGAHAGHLVGQFPHETIDGAKIESYIAPGSTQPMRRLDRSGRQCHWILEIHLVDRERQFGGFHEELLDLGH